MNSFPFTSMLTIKLDKQVHLNPKKSHRRAANGCALWSKPPGVRTLRTQIDNEISLRSRRDSIGMTHCVYPIPSLRPWSRTNMQHIATRLDRNQYQYRMMHKSYHNETLLSLFRTSACAPSETEEPHRRAAQSCTLWSKPISSGYHARIPRGSRRNFLLGEHIAMQNPLKSTKSLACLCPNSELGHTNPLKFSQSPLKPIKIHQKPRVSVS